MGKRTICCWHPDHLISGKPVRHILGLWPLLHFRKVKYLLSRIEKSTVNKRQPEHLQCKVAGLASHRPLRTVNGMDWKIGWHGKCYFKITPSKSISFCLIINEMLHVSALVSYWSCLLELEASTENIHFTVLSQMEIGVFFQLISSTEYKFDHEFVSMKSWTPATNISHV